MSTQLRGQQFLHSNHSTCYLYLSTWPWGTRSKPQAEAARPKPIIMVLVLNTLIILAQVQTADHVSRAEWPVLPLPYFCDLHTLLHSRFETPTPLFLTLAPLLWLFRCVFCSAQILWLAPGSWSQNTVDRKKSYVIRITRNMGQSPTWGRPGGAQASLYQFLARVKTWGGSKPYGSKYSLSKNSIWVCQR